MPAPRRPVAPPGEQVDHSPYGATSYFRIVISAPNVRLADLDVDGGGIVVDDTSITWAEPDHNRIVQIRKPTP